MINKLKDRLEKIKKQLIVLHLAYLDVRTPVAAKVLIFIIIAYALSPIDLIPDFIPVLGYLDDIILIPIVIYFIVKLIPAQVLEDANLKAQDYKWNKKHSKVGLVIVLLIWLVFVLSLLNYCNNLNRT